MEEITAYTEPGLRSWKIPRDGTYRYLYDTWQPLALFVLTVCFTAVFYSVYTPFATIPFNDLFYCNVDGNLVKADGSYKQRRADARGNGSISHTASIANADYGSIYRYYADCCLVIL